MNANLYEEIMRDLTLKLARAKNKVDDLSEKILSHQRENQVLVCRGDHAGPGKGCGTELRPCDVVYIRTHWYESPHGCTGGDTWHEGEGQFDCPKCGKRSRLYDDPRFNQKPALFKSAVDEHK